MHKRFEKPFVPFVPLCGYSSCMIRRTFALITLFAVGTTYSAAPQSRSSNSVVLYEGARLIPGDGGRPIESGAMLVENGVITRVGPKGGVNVPRGAMRIDLTGKTVMPTL